MATSANIPAKTARMALESAFDAIKTVTLTGNSVSLAGFGKFKLVDRAARVGRHPITGAALSIPRTRVLKFTPKS